MRDHIDETTFVSCPPIAFYSNFIRTKWLWSDVTNKLEDNQQI